MTETVETEENDTDKSIYLITEMKHSTDRRKYVTMTIRIYGTEKKFIVDTRSPVTIIQPENAIIKGLKNIPVRRKYQDVNKNEVKFTGKITVKAESKRNRKNLSMLITEREDIKSLLGMDWLREFNCSIGHIEKCGSYDGRTNEEEMKWLKLISNFLSETMRRTDGAEVTLSSMSLNPVLAKKNQKHQSKTQLNPNLYPAPKKVTWRNLRWTSQ